MTERDQIILGVVAVAAAIAAFFFLALKPKRAESQKLDTQISEQVTKRDQLQARVSAGRAAQAEFAESYGEVARLGKAVPPNDQTPSLLYQLQSAADDHGVDFNGIEVKTSGGTSGAAPAPVGGTQAAAAVAPPGSQVGPAGFPTLPFDFNFEGDFFKLERFLAEVERFTTTSGTDDIEVRGRLLTVDGLALFAAARGGFPDVQVSVAATAYVLPPSEGLTGGASSSGPAGSAGAPGQTASGTAPSTPTAAGVTK